MTMRCKFYVTSVTKVDARGWHTEPKVDVLYEATFSAVTSSGSEENKKFFASTPTGSLSFKAVNGDKFEVGNEYYIDITKAE